MKTSLDCIPCLLRQSIDFVRLCNVTDDVRERTVQRVLLATAKMDFSSPPPVLAERLQPLLREMTGCDDPYREAKQQFNRFAAELLPPLAAAALRSDDPFASAVRLSIAGNVIDLGAKSGLTEDEVRKAASLALAQPLIGALEDFRSATQVAKRILYLTDNAGEIVFDRFLIEQLPSGCVTVAVRGRPVINDATREDALAAGLPAIAEVIDNGSAAPGTVLAECAPDFRRRFSEADLIIAKGQGNFETLHDASAPIFCLFRVKCTSVARHCGHPIGSHLVWSVPNQKN